ncbi:MAG TPA: hypothetical protein VHG29_10670 [Novosphingobium sp.]|nr:hypothetical protein [Novosphingobium sp.]
MRETHNATSRLRSATALSVVAASIAIANPAWAQASDSQATEANQAASRTTVYEADFFKPFAPATALDIARRVPGFNLDLGNENVRGFAGAAGNVVFNGARPSSKSDSLETLLARIPASRVLRVEMGPGDLYGSDYAGKSQVLNVILTASGGVDGNVTLKGRHNYDGSFVPNAEGSVLLKRGDFSANLAAGTGRYDQTEEGFDRITDAATGAQLEYRRKINEIHPHEPYVSASLGIESTPDHAVHLNGRFAPSTFTLEQSNQVTPASGPMRNDRLLNDYDNTGLELGGDLTRPLGGGALKFVGLANRRHRDNYDASFRRVNSVVIGGFEQLSDSRYGETLGRLSWSKAKLLGMSVELGSEVAYNRLINATDLYVLGSTGVRTRIDLPIDQATVAELRTESYLKAGREVAKGVRIDGGLAYETSRLTVSGDTSAKRSLHFLKPNVTLDLTPKGGWHIQLIARRTVSQLDFYDFISNAELAVSRVNGGNADLQPQRSWEFRATVEHPLLGAGLAKLEVGHDRVSLLQDLILTPDGFDAPGNIGTGKRIFAQLTLDAPLDRLGLKGFHFRGDGTLQRTRVTDPLTGATRGWSGFWPESQWNLELRRDAANWAAGINASKQSRITFYRTDELDSNFNRSAFVSVFAEYRPDKRTTVRLDVDNLTDIPGNRERHFFSPNRSAPRPFADEFRERNQHVSFTLSIRRGFGGGSAK